MKQLSLKKLNASNCTTETPNKLQVVPEFHADELNPTECTNLAFVNELCLLILLRQFSLKE